MGMYYTSVFTICRHNRFVPLSNARGWIGKMTQLQGRAPTE